MPELTALHSYVRLGTPLVWFTKYRCQVPPLSEFNMAPKLFERVPQAAVGTSCTRKELNSRLWLTGDCVCLLLANVVPSTSVDLVHLDRRRVAASPLSAQCVALGGSLGSAGLVVPGTQSRSCGIGWCAPPLACGAAGCVAPQWRVWS